MATYTEKNGTKPIQKTATEKGCQMSSVDNIVLDIKDGINRKDELYKEIHRLLYRLCMRYRDFARELGFELGDLVSAAWIGVEKAIDGFEPDKGSKFTTYLTYHVNMAVQNMLGIRNGKQVVQTISLDAPLTEAEDITLLDTVSDTEATELLEKAEKYDYYNILLEEVEKLPPELSEVLKRHYLSNESITHIAETKNLPFERINWHKRKALSMLFKNRRIKECYYDEVAYRHTTLSGFKRTWTSSTEWAALKVIQEDERGIE